MRSLGEFRILLLGVSILWGTPVVLLGEEHGTNGVAPSMPRSSASAYGRLETTRLVLEQSEETVSFRQEIFNEQNTLVEIHEKYPIDKGHIKLTDHENQ